MPDALSVDGEMRDYCSIADSGNVIYRRFCPRYGAHLTSRTEVRPHLVIVRVEILNALKIAKPPVTIGIECA